MRRSFTDAKVLEDKIDKYFESLIRTSVVRDNKGQIVKDEDGQPVTETITKPCTLSRLAIYLDVNKETIQQYKRGAYDTEDQCYSVPIKKAIQRIEAYAEECLFDTDRRSYTGIIFNLKNNFDWKDKREVTTNTNVQNNILITGKDELIKAIGGMISAPINE